MRYFRSFVFDAGLAFTLVGVLAALWTTKDMIALRLKFYLFRRRLSRDRGSSGIAAVSMNLSGLVLAVAVAVLGLGILLVATILVWRSA